MSIDNWKKYTLGVGMENRNIRSWNNYITYNKSEENNLFKLPVSKRFEILYTRLYDIASCFGRSKGYDRYVIPDVNGGYIKVMDLPKEHVRRLYEIYKEEYFKELQEQRRNNE